LRDGLEGQDMIDLIKLLQKELLVDRQPCNEANMGIGIEDVGLVADLLVAALDTIGIGGSVLGHKSEGFIQELHGEVIGAVQAAEALRVSEEMFRHAD
jgi:hypothetical protein